MVAFGRYKVRCELPRYSPRIVPDSAGTRFGRRIAKSVTRLLDRRAGRTQRDGPKEGAPKLKPLAKFAVYMVAARMR